MTAPEPTHRRLTPELLATLLIVLAYILWLLSMPAWPSQDGPVHLYYTHVFGALLSHHPTPYAHFYTIKHLLPPYALYYYALLALSHVTSLLLADRLILCIYVISFVFGFRYLARALGPSADLTTLLATLLLLNWSLGMGFVNFCLSLSIVFWALGLWLRFAGRPALPQRIVFVLLAILAMFTHPVPLLALLGLAALALILRFLRDRRATHTLPPFFLRDLLTLIAAALTLGYVKLFTNSHPLAQTAVTASSASRSFLSQLAHNIVDYAAEKGLAFLSGPGVELRLYRIVLLIAIVLPLALAARQRLRNRRQHLWTASDTTLVLGILAILVLPFIPHDLNGSHFFADRLLLLVWLLPIFAATGYTIRSPRARASLLLFVLLAQLLILSAANAKLRPVAESIARLDNAPQPIASTPGTLGLLLEDPRPSAPPPGLAFNPFLWAAANAFRHDNTILANTPWLDLAIIPLGAAPALPAANLPPAALEFPAILRSDLEADPAQRAQLLHSVSFLAIDQSFRRSATGLDPLLTLDHPASLRWSCRNAATPWLRICNKQTP
ncbi:MAG TPA: hypothetical protein VHY48_00965 [Acidobacteriaceae bacterium]|jgi:hypothetical protein|nr:hypothetical protein [Acidobacteriaceae bacterium]